MVEVWTGEENSKAESLVAGAGVIFTSDSGISSRTLLGSLEMSSQTFGTDVVVYGIVDGVVVYGIVDGVVVYGIVDGVVVYGIVDGVVVYGIVDGVVVSLGYV